MVARFIRHRVLLVMMYERSSFAGPTVSMYLYLQGLLILIIPVPLGGLTCGSPEAAAAAAAAATAAGISPNSGGSLEHAAKEVLLSERRSLAHMLQGHKLRSSEVRL